MYKTRSISSAALSAVMMLTDRSWMNDSGADWSSITKLVCFSSHAAVREQVQELQQLEVCTSATVISSYCYIILIYLFLSYTNLKLSLSGWNEFKLNPWPVPFEHFKLSISLCVFVLAERVGLFPGECGQRSADNRCAAVWRKDGRQSEPRNSIHRWKKWKVSLQTRPECGAPAKTSSEHQLVWGDVCCFLTDQPGKTM